jgi:hypothetical protein
MLSTVGHNGPVEFLQTVFWPPPQAVATSKPASHGRHGLQTLSLCASPCSYRNVPPGQCRRPLQ